MQDSIERAAFQHLGDAAPLAQLPATRMLNEVENLPPLQVSIGTAFVALICAFTCQEAIALGDTEPARKNHNELLGIAAMLEQAALSFRQTAGAIN